jgi:7-cyano-7-deazaguanine reductase
MKLPEIETWEFQYPGTDTTLEVSIPEFTCICPKTGLPDFATLVVTYVPGKLCLELKSFKEYINAYRELGIFHEHVVNKLLADCVKACKPRSMEVRGVFNARGGIMSLEDSVFLGDAIGPRKTQQIVIRGSTETPGPLNWALRRVEKSAAANSERVEMPLLPF